MPPADHELSFEQFQREVSAGRLRIGIRRSQALAVFRGQTLAVIEQQTGLRPRAVWLAVKGAAVAAPLGMGAASVFWVMLLPWWSLLALSAAIAGYFVYRERSLDPDSGLAGITLLLLSLILAPLFIPETRLSNLHGAMLMLCISFWSSRFAPILATWRIRRLMLESDRAYATFKGSVLVLVSPVDEPPP